MANFSVSNSTVGSLGAPPVAIAATYKTIIIGGVGSSVATSGVPTNWAPRRGKIYDILIGTPSTPGDTAIQWDCQRATALGSSQASNFAGGVSSFSSVASLDAADVGCGSYLVANCSAETGMTFATDIWNVGINQRASYRWVAAPGSELVWPAVSSNGIGLRAVQGGGTYTGLVTAAVLIQEQ